MQQFLPFFALILVTFPDPIGSVLQVEIGCPGFVDPASSGSALSFNGPAFELAVEESNRRYAVITNISIRYLYESDGNPTSVIDASGYLVSQWYYRQRSYPDGVAVIMSPGLLDTTTIHQLAASWNILYFQTVLFDFSHYHLPAAPVLATYAGFVTSISRPINEFLLLHKLTTVFLVVDLTNSPFGFTADYNVLEASFAVNPLVTVYKRRIAAQDYEIMADGYGSLLDDFKSCSRVLLFLARADHMRRLLVDAALRNMTNGEFLYLYIAVPPSFPTSRFGNMSWNYGDQFDQISKQSFQSLIVVREHVVNSTETHRDLLGEMRRRARREFGVTIEQKDQTLSDLLACFSTVTMLARVINESLATEDANATQNGFQLSQHFLNRIFRDNFSEILLSENGIRRKPMAVTFFPHGHQPEKIFFAESNEPPFGLISTANMTDFWPNSAGWPPPNRPLCGYQQGNDLCREHPYTLQRPSTIIFSSIAALGCLSLFTVACYFRHVLRRRRKHRQQDGWWRLENPWAFSS